MTAFFIMLFLIRAEYKFKKTFLKAQLMLKQFKSFLIFINQATCLVTCHGHAAGCKCAAETTTSGAQLFHTFLPQTLYPTYVRHERSSVQACESGLSASLLLQC